MDKLYIVIPAYNEEMNIGNVVADWHAVVAKTSPDSRLLIIDDGSKDRTLFKLQELKLRFPQLETVAKSNGGHGSAILFGYHHALSQGADYVFQTDSDGQTLASEFDAFWLERKIHDAIIGHRNRRQDGISRIVVTKVLKLVLWCIFGENITDANSPFRLVSAEALRKCIVRIPDGFHLSNVLLSVLLVKDHAAVCFKPITFQPRQGGRNFINFRRITSIGFQAVKDFRRIKRELAKT